MLIFCTAEPVFWYIFTWSSCAFFFSIHVHVLVLASTILCILFLQDGKETSVGAKRCKYGAKTSRLQSQGCLQIEHFFGKG